MRFATFRSRLIGILVFIDVCVLLLGGGAYHFLGEVNDRLEHFTRGIYARLEIANRLREAADARAIAVRNLALITDPATSAEQARQFERRQVETRQAIDALQAAVANPEVPEDVRRRVAAIAAVEARYSPVAADIVGQIQSGQRQEAIARIAAVCTPTLIELTSAIGDYMHITEQRTRAYVDETEALTHRERTLLMVAALAAASLAAALGYLLRRNVQVTLGAEPESLKATLGQLAAGDLSTSAGAGDARDGSVAGEIRRVQQQIGDIVRQVRASSENIATGSAQIASGNADLSERTEEQASSLQRTAGAMDELGSTVRRNAESAQQADQFAQGAATVATEGGQVVGQVVTTMQGISESSRRIGDIIGVIDGIAFQTNILALNAAVEAARAGEQGRGFAVVAGEVRTLAQRSAEAAREIKTLIGRNVEQVEQGAALVDRAGKTMGEIVASVRRVSDIVSEITSATVEQGRGIHQVGDAVGKMDQVTQQNAALVEQSAAAAESLKAQAEQLVQAVSRFKVAGGAQGHGSAEPSPVARAATPAPRPAAKAPAPAPTPPATPAKSPSGAPAPSSMPAPRAALGSAKAPAKAPASATARPTAAVPATTAESDDWTSF